MTLRELDKYLEEFKASPDKDRVVDGMWFHKYRPSALPPSPFRDMLLEQTPDDERILMIYLRAGVDPSGT